MRVTSLVVVASTAVASCFFACKWGAEPLKAEASILFVRDSEGNKAFYASPDQGQNIAFTVTRYDFRDTNYAVSAFADDSGRLSSLLTRVLDNKVSIEGDFTQSTLPTGSWVRKCCC